MAITVQTVEVSGVPDVFALLSSDHMRSLSDSIAQGTEIKFGNIFGVNYDHGAERELFLNSIKRDNTVVAEIIESGLRNTFTANNIICINTKEKLLMGIPSRMEEIVITTKPLREALKRDEIYGFGIDPKTIPNHDPYRRVLKGGSTSKDGIHTSVVSSHDPCFTIDELLDIEETREFLVDVFNEGYDPTDFPFKRGKIK